jgi:hypothetical protein
VVVAGKKQVSSYIKGRFACLAASLANHKKMLVFAKKAMRWEVRQRRPAAAESGDGLGPGRPTWGFRLRGL